MSPRILRALTLALLTTTALAQTPQSLPPNYQTILDNKDVLVMRVHYGPHEFVPMHDHSAYPTVYVYLNDSGEVRIDHEPPNAFSVTRPPTHTGAFRVAPGMKERHSITNLSDTPSDFLRVELKSIPTDAITKVFRGDEPSPPFTRGANTAYTSPSLRIERILCAPPAPCPVDAYTSPSVLVNIPLEDTAASRPFPTQVKWLPVHAYSTIFTDTMNGMPGRPFELLRIVLPGS